MNIRNSNTRLLAFVLFLCTQGLFVLANNPSTVCYNFDSCNSDIYDGTNQIYSEFTAQINNVSGCGSFSAGNLYRLNPTENTHSCTPGINDTPAMCVTSYQGCIFYEPAFEKAVRFDVTLSPTGTESISLGKLEFYERAPERFQYIDGAEGPNNFPTLYGVRVLVDGNEIYRQEGIPTSEEWTLESLDFTSNPAFTIANTTTFEFQLVPYCIVGNGNATTAWDIDDLKIYSDCGLDDVLPPVITTTNGGNSIDICDGFNSEFDVNVTFGSGTNHFYIVTDQNGVILDLPAGPPFNLNSIQNGICQLSLVSYNGTISGFSVGNTLNSSNQTGCFAISNSITVLKEGPSGGTITSNGATDITIDLCDASGVDTQVDFTLSGATGLNNNFIVTDGLGNIVLITTGNTVDFGLLGAGNFSIWNISFDGFLTNFAVGNNINQVVGCFGLSNPISINRSSVFAGDLTAQQGGTEFTFCTSDGISDLLNLVINNPSGMGFQWIVTDENGNIIELPASGNFEFEGVPSGVCFIYHLAYRTGFVLPTIGSNLASLTGCFDITDPIQVVRNQEVAGTISSPQGDMITFCVTDGEQSIVNASMTGPLGSNSTWLVTDQKGIIQQVQASPPFDFSGSDPGVCLIWHLNYSDGMFGMGIGEDINDMRGCLGLSNSIQVIKQGAEAGTISSPQGTVIDICIDNHAGGSGTGSGSGTEGISGIVDVELDEERIFKKNETVWVIYDENGNILELPAGPPFDFRDAGSGTCFIAHYAYDTNNPGLNVGANISNLNGCFDSSNVITVNRNEVEAGMIIGDQSQTTINLCFSDSNSPMLNVSFSESPSETGTWVVTDSNGIILELDGGPPFDFSGAGPGTCNIYHVVHEDNLGGLFIGGDVESLRGCFDISNAITVNRNQIETASITVNGATNINVCSSDGNDIIAVTRSGADQTPGSYVVTDINGNIVLVSNTSPINLSSLNNGSYFIYYVTFATVETVLNVGGNVSLLEGCFSLSNPISITLSDIDGGSISTSDPLDVCVGNGVADIVNVSLQGATGASSSYVVTDINGNILELSNVGQFDFDGAGLGTCLIWHVSFEAGLTGLAIGSNVNSISGCHDFSNPLTVTRNQADGGTLTTAFGDNIEVCIGDGLDENIDVVVSNPSGNNFSWVITDAAGNILALPIAPPFSFENAGVGVCNIWHMAFSSGVTGLDIGSNVSGLVGCFDFSNPITVTRSSVEAGSISTTDPLNICVGDGVTDQVNVTLSGNNAPNNSWIITDDNGNILELPTAPPFSFEDAGVGVCQIWNIAYLSSLTGLSVGANVSGLNGCFDLSNPITVTRSQVESGTISSSLGTDITLCLNDDQNDLVDVTLSGAQGNTSWIITDGNGNITSLPSGPPFDFSNFNDGFCFIYSISSAGTPSTAIGTNIANLTGCFELTSPIRVLKAGVDGGTITTPDPTSVCVGDGSADLVNVTVSGNVGQTSLWVITDESGNILELPSAPPFDFDDAGPGTCLIWNLTHSGTITGATIGANAANITGCFDLSNAITVQRNEVNGGTISSPLGDNIVVCGETSIDVTLTGNAGDSQIWILTNSSGTILETYNSSPITIGDLPAGTCTISSVSSVAGTTGIVAGANVNSISGCFAMSNGITISKDEVEGGVATLPNGATELLICGEVDERFTIVEVAGDTGDNGTWAFVDSEGTILIISDAGSFELDGVASEIFTIVYISGSGPVQGITVGSNISDLTGCFDFSTPVIVNKRNSNPGVIVFDDGSTNMTICSGDNMDDIINATVTGQQGSSESWIIADTNGNILELPATMPYNFEAFPVAQCFIYHITFESNIAGLTIGANLVNLTGCFGLSNAITINKQAIQGGSLVGESGTDSETICLVSGGDNTINFTITGNQGQLSQFVITDLAGNIIALPGTSDIDFSTFATGTCLVWHLSYFDGLVGATIGANASNLMGCFALSNPVTVNKFGNIDPVITGPDGDSYTFCTNDATPDILTVELDDKGCVFGEFVLIGEDGLIIDFLDGPSFDFGGLPTQECTLFYVCFENEDNGLSPGWPLDATIGCFDTSNPLTIDKINVNGGSLTTSTGTTEFTSCNGDEELDGLEVTLTGNTGRNIWVVTDMDCDVLSIPPGPPFDFSAFNATCQLWNLSFDGSIGDVQTGDNLKTDIEGCFGLSNPITVFKGEVDAGAITIEGSEGKSEIDICAGDGADDIINIIVTGETQTGSGTSDIILTDIDGNILDISNPPYNFENFATGTCLIYNVSALAGFTGLAVGNNIDEDFVGCYDLSNPITVNKCNVGAGTITFADGSTSLDICSGDGVPDVVTILDSDEGARNCRYIVTAPNGDILLVDNDPSFDLEGTPNQNCHIYNICFKGESLEFLAAGFNISKFEGCFDFSNRLNVTKCFVDGGTISDVNGDTEVHFCVADGESDFLTLQAVGGSGTTDVVITDPMGMITEYPVDLTSFDFDDETGECLVWRIAYKELPGGLSVGTNAADLTGCFALSNPVTVIKDEVTSCGLTFADSGLTQAIVCVADSFSDILEFENDCTTDNNFQYVVANTTGVITDIVADTTYNFGGSIPGTCRIYGIDYTGIFTANVGDDIDTITNFSTECSMLASNFLEVTKSANPGDCASIAPGEGPIIANVYPNPTQDFIYVNIEQFPDAEGSIHLIDIVGRELQAIPINNEIGLYRIDVRDLAQGNYILQIGSKKESKIHRFNKIVK